MMLLLPFLAGGEAFAGKDATFWMPPQASTNAADVDFVFYFIYWTCVVFFIVLMGAMIGFAFKYKQRQEGEKTNPIKGSHSLELAWSVLPGFLLLAFFWFGFTAWMDNNVPPANAMEVRVEGQRWSWTFSYPTRDGVTSDTLKVPAGVPVQLTMSSKDVLHSFYIPDFRIKKDVLPNRYTVIWFQADESGEHNVFCTEYCGTAHSKMLSKVEVMEPRDFNAWVHAEKLALAATGTMTGPERGKQLYAKQGCAGCHSLDGSRIVGPTFKGAYGKQEALEGGATVTVDDNYIRESITVPGAKIVAGYPAVMPPYQGVLTDEQINDLIDFIKSLNE